MSDAIKSARHGLRRFVMRTTNPPGAMLESAMSEHRRKAIIFSQASAMLYAMASRCRDIAMATTNQSEWQQAAATVWKHAFAHRCAYLRELREALK